MASNNIANIQTPNNTKNYVVFENDGMIDASAITTFGLSVKSSANDNPIGYFGTGLKYAIAILIRHDIDIKIYSGENELSFKKKEKEFRGEKVEIIAMSLNGGRYFDLPFTTKLGKNWELWQAFRELYSNCLDENGTSFDGQDTMPEYGKTKIVINGEKFKELYANREEIFISGDSLIKTEHADIHGGQSNNIFYRGIRVATVKKPLMYKYNIKKHITLTEDRTIAYSWQVGDSIVDAVLSSNDPEFIESILMASDDMFESTLNFGDNRQSMSDTFKTKVSELKRTKPTKTNASAINLYEKDLPIEQKFEKYNPTNEEMIALTQAIDFLAELNISIDDFKIENLKSLGDEILAYVQSDTIYLSSRIYSMGTKQIASTLFEEWAHLTYGYADCTREMQTYLFDTVISMGEKITNKIL